MNKKMEESASQVSSRREGHTLDTSETPDFHWEIEELGADVYLGSDPFF